MTTTPVNWNSLQHLLAFLRDRYMDGYTTTPISMAAKHLETNAATIYKLVEQDSAWNHVRLCTDHVAGYDARGYDRDRKITALHLTHEHLRKWIIALRQKAMHFQPYYGGEPTCPKCGAETTWNHYEDYGVCPSCKPDLPSVD